MLLDLQARPILPPDRQVLSEIDWSEVATLWNTNELGVLHDLLNERWSRLIRNSVLGTRDPEAEFLQGLAFATLALFFTQNRNQEGGKQARRHGGHRVVKGDDCAVSPRRRASRILPGAAATVPR